MDFVGMFHVAKLAGRPLQFAAQNPDVPRRVKRERHPVPGNPANLKDDVISHVNPFTNLTT
jgi:hypothetical protein